MSQKTIKTIVFVSNFLNHHQLYLCNELSARCESFYFVSTAITGKGNYTGGFQKEIEADYVLHYNDQTQKELADRLIMEADAVIFGVCDSKTMSQRVERSLLSFIYSERFFKNGKIRRFIPTTWKSIYERALKYKDNDKFFVLCASAYMPYDLSILKFNTSKCFRWGYFTQVKEYEDFDKLIKNKKKHSILWVGRFLKLKHTELAVRVAKRLKDEGYDFTLDIVGSGERERQIKDLIKRAHLEDRVTMCGEKTPVQVREYMESSEIFLFTSNKQEGWGAVLNESMNSACAVVACRAIGSVPFLIEDGVNGYSFKQGDFEDLYQKTKALLLENEKREKIAKAAYKTIIEKWSPSVAAQRFVSLATSLINGTPTEGYKDGPCSPAEVIKDGQ